MTNSLEDKRHSGPPCKAVLTIKGEHITCDWPTDENGEHTGWGHANKRHEAIWSGVDPFAHRKGTK